MKGILLLSVFLNCSLSWGSTFQKSEMKFAKIPSATFDMGARWTSSNENEKPNHKVTLSKDFEMQTTETTQGQWFQVMGTNPSFFKAQDDCPADHQVISGIEFCPNHPVERISFSDAQNYIAKLNAQDPNYTYSIPTEAQWEYASSGGARSTYFFGENEKDLNDYAWYDIEEKGFTHDVGLKKPNQFGLYDIYGNVSEWTNDWFSHYGKADVVDPQGPASGEWQSVRGGDWYNYPNLCTSRARWVNKRNDSDESLGLRVVRTKR